MTITEILVLGGFGLPIAGLSIYFICAARRMMREEIEREKMRQQTARLIRQDRKRRRARYIAAQNRTGVCR